MLNQFLPCKNFKVWFSVGLVLLVASACAPSETAVSIPEPTATANEDPTSLPADLIDQKWVLVGAGSDTSDMFLPPEGAWLRFSADLDPNGEPGYSWTGFSGCNQLFGSYSVDENRLLMRIGQTEQGCVGDYLGFETFMTGILRGEPMFSSLINEDDHALVLQLPNDENGRLNFHAQTETENTAADGLLMRVHNGSDQTLENIVMDNRLFGNLAPGETSIYRWMEMSYRYPGRLEVTVDGQLRTLQAVDFVGETPLDTHQAYTQEIFLSGDGLAHNLVPEGPVEAAELGQVAALSQVLHLIEGTGIWPTTIARLEADAIGWRAAFTDGRLVGRVSDTAAAPSDTSRVWQVENLTIGYDGGTAELIDALTAAYGAPQVGPNASEAVAFNGRKQNETYVTIDIYSGQPNPEWVLSDEEWVELHNLVVYAPAPTTIPDWSNLGLGYRGIIVESPTTLYRILDGVVSFQAKGMSGIEYYADSDYAIEAYVLNTAAEHGVDIESLRGEIMDHRTP